MFNKKKYFFILLFVVVGCNGRVTTIKDDYVKLTLTGDIVPGDWLEVNDYRIEFQLPDELQAVPENVSYNPYILRVSDNDPQTGLVAPSKTYQVGPGKPILMPVPKGVVLYNIMRILTLLSYHNSDSLIFDFKSDNTMALQGLLIVGMKGQEDINITHPEQMNILVEPFVPKKPKAEQ
jgi:hypothetical protein